MEILGIGPSELIFIVIIAIIILGPRDMQKAGKTVGRWLNQFVRSDGWKALQRASKEIRSLPTTLMREANLEEFQTLDKDIRRSIDPRTQSPVSAPSRSAPPSNPLGTSPEPPAVDAETNSQGSSQQEPDQK
jgi:sec-independent protein translocase protein TatB